MSQYAAILHRRSTTYFGMLDYELIVLCRTVPTQNDILVPETLLKKRKSQEKARAERAAEIEKRKKVGVFLFSVLA
jgi:hypothetical protein